MPSTRQKAKRRMRARQKKLQSKTLVVAKTENGNMDKLWQESAERIAQLQGTFAVQIAPEFPPLIIEVRRGNGWKEADLKGFYVRGSFCRYLDNHRKISFQLGARMSMQDTEIYEHDRLFWTTIRFGYDVHAAIECGTPTRAYIDYNLLLVPRKNARAQKHVFGRFVLENKRIAVYKKRAEGDTLWSKRDEFVKLSKNITCVDGEHGRSYLKLMMAKAVSSAN